MKTRFQCYLSLLAVLLSLQGNASAGIPAHGDMEFSPPALGDTDSDETPNGCEDALISDSAKTAAGSCGFGVADEEFDDDGSPNCEVLPPSDPARPKAGVIAPPRPAVVKENKSETIEHFETVDDAKYRVTTTRTKTKNYLENCDKTRNGFEITRMSGKNGRSWEAALFDPNLGFPIVAKGLADLSVSDQTTYAGQNAESVRSYRESAERSISISSRALQQIAGSAADDLIQAERAADLNPEANEVMVPVWVSKSVDSLSMEPMRFESTGGAYLPVLRKSTTTTRQAVTGGPDVLLETLEAIEARFEEYIPDRGSTCSRTVYSNAAGVFDISLSVRGARMGGTINARFRLQNNVPVSYSYSKNGAGASGPQEELHPETNELIAAAAWNFVNLDCNDTEAVFRVLERSGT